MKKILFTLTLFIVTITVFAQAGKKVEEESNCYIRWAQKFEARGAEDVADGTYSDVIITFRTGSDAECFNGKCDVKDGRIIAMYTKLEDGTYALVKKKLRYDFPVTITNGMSKTVPTLDDELINVLFVKKIKPKKASFERAAEPTDD
ncbi:MAG: hypothetical protein Q8L90_17655 [Bacteroidota bacterium]|nr:hypothetical protein [Bacteroidota bacterium]